MVRVETENLRATATERKEFPSEIDFRIRPEFCRVEAI
jgi:hypothetical protein